MSSRPQFSVNVNRCFGKEGSVHTWTGSHGVQQEVHLVLVLVADTAKLGVVVHGGPVNPAVGIGAVEAPSLLAASTLYQPAALHTVVPRTVPPAPGDRLLAWSSIACT
jgi:hypothetical protein